LADKGVTLNLYHRYHRAAFCYIFQMLSIIMVEGRDLKTNLLRFGPMAELKLAAPCG